MSFQPARYDVTFIRRHAAHDIREKAFAFEQAFRSYINSSVVVANLPPGAPINAARFQMADGKRTLAVTNNAVQLTLEFGTSIPAQRSWPDLLSKPAGLMDWADQHFPEDADAFKAVILQISRPYQGSQNDVTNKIAQLFSVVPDGQPVSAGYTFAVNESDLTTLYEISQYKFFELTASGPNAAAVVANIDVEFLPASDEGLQLKVEANTKSNLRLANKTSFATLVAKIDAGLQDDLAIRVLGA